MRHSLAAAVLVAVIVPASLADAASRPLRVEDVFALKDVGDPRVSPEGRWVAYTVTGMDPKEDETDTDVYMAPLAGGTPLRLTTSKKAERSPRFSPDGRYLAFLSGREGKKSQVWLLHREGGEAVRLTQFKASVSDLVWSPDSTRLALVVSDVDPDDPDAGDDEEAEAEGDKDKKKTPKPIVIRRRQFKRDTEGYLREFRNHVYVFDVQGRAAVQVTFGPYDDIQPAWSPDGRFLSFTSNRTADPDANQDTDVFVVRARAGETPRRLATGPGEDKGGVWSPDGASVVYLAGGDPKDMWYGANHVAVVPVDGGPARPLTKALDRNVASPLVSPDGRNVYFLLEDGGNSHLARVPFAGGPVERVVAGERDVSAFDLNSRGDLVVLESEPHHPEEVYAVGARGALRRITSVNDALLKGIRLGTVERFKARSPEGTMVDAFLTRPPDAPAGTRLPTLLRIHGGPTSQYSTAFNLEWQLLAAHSYAVVAANPRGSTGYGTAFSRAIWADWGNKDYDDVMAAVDKAIGMGVADPDRLGVGGWSYGGILTDYVITRTGRFKAAVSGASEANYLANYGTDHYQYEWETELGLPWRNVEAWVKLSPWFNVEKVTTPTLLMGGADDMNVPTLNSEQLYQALRRLGRETELVIYPGQHHGITKPSYVKDRYERYLAWYDKYLKPAAAAPAAPSPEATSLLGKPLFPPEITPERRRTLEANLARAAADFVRNPDSADAIIWVGRRTAYLGRFREAVDIFTRGIERHPSDPRLYRHRGHRDVTLRQFDKAIADFEKAVELMAGRSEEIEPDGDPNPLNIPTSTLQFNVWYHLGLAHYLKADFEKALAAYRQCMKFSQGSNDRLVATSDWLYMTLRRLGRDAEAAQVLVPIQKDMDVIENHAYFHRLLMYKGEKKPEELLGVTADATDAATHGYGVGNWYLYNGQKDKAKDVFEHVVRGPQWAAFGFIAAEAELARMR